MKGRAGFTGHVEAGCITLAMVVLALRAFGDITTGNANPAISLCLLAAALWGQRCV
jgi:hypothetical protein